MTELRFWMAGSNGWRQFFPSKQAYAVYEHVYQEPHRIVDIASKVQILEEEVIQIVSKWVEVGFAKKRGDGILGQVPVINDRDYATLDPWFRHVAQWTSEAIRNERRNYQDLAEKVSVSQDQRPIDNILTILICAGTLDVGTLSVLKRGLMGEPPQRGERGRYFFWGKKTEKGPRYPFGVNSYGSGKEGKWFLSMIHSKAVDRTSLRRLYSKMNGEMSQMVKLLGALAEKPRDPLDLHEIVPFEPDRLKDLVESLAKVRLVTRKEPYSLLIPVFDEKVGPKVNELCLRVSKAIAKKIEDNLDQLKGLVKKCSFQHCQFGDIFCMVFHEGYDYATDELLEEDIIPPFPSKATAEWGMWMSIRGVSAV